jgi:hypothetical protein
MSDLWLVILGIATGIFVLVVVASALERRAKNRGALFTQKAAPTMRITAVVLGVLFGGFFLIEVLFTDRVHIAPPILAIALIGFGSGSGRLIRRIQTGTDPAFLELERQMRPGALSERGFLGPTESLATVIARDSQTLERLGISHEQIADELGKVLRAVMDRRQTLVRSDHDEYRKKETHVPNLYDPGSVPRFSLDNLPNTDTGYLVGEKLHVFIAEYRGLQECPWGCDYDVWSCFDFLILNRKTGRYVTGPGLGVHLIRKHHFFEGVESPYRTDPEKLFRTLELG